MPPHPRLPRRSRTDQAAQPDPQRPTPELLIWAYRQGVFPMADPDSGVIEWFSPDPRGILPLEKFHIPHALSRIVRQNRFTIRADTAFEKVMRECAAAREDDDDTWIDERLIGAYTGLHAIGHAHCVEAWIDRELVGGLYGVSIGAAFFGESMFSRPERGGSNASKVCLVHLVEHLRRCEFQLLDTQFWNPHLAQFGCEEIPRDEYLRQLAEAIDVHDRWGAFNAR